MPLVVSHHKCAGPADWGRAVQTLAHIGVGAGVGLRVSGRRLPAASAAAEWVCSWILPAREERPSWQRPVELDNQVFLANGRCSLERQMIVRSVSAISLEVAADVANLGPQTGITSSASQHQLLLK